MPKPIPAHWRQRVSLTITPEALAVLKRIAEVRQWSLSHVVDQLAMAQAKKKP